MLVLNINKNLNWIQIYDGRGRYTCITEERDGELYFKFKNEWHKVKDYTSEYTSEYNG
jgi:hypothetical protein